MRFPLIKGHAPFSHFTVRKHDFIPDEGMRKSQSSATCTCPQAAFKYHVTFDRILGEIQKRVFERGHHPDAAHV